MTVKYTVDVEENGTKHWYLNGKRHRVDGPAVEWSGGRKEWHLNGKQLSEEQFNARHVKTIEIDGVKYKLTRI